MQVADSGKLQSAINVTPLVDVVLVLLIIFMIVAPQLDSGPELQLPETDRPPKKIDDGAELALSVERDGHVWIEGDRVSVDDLGPRVRDAATRHGEAQVLIKADARLTFGQVRHVLDAVQAAGLRDVGLITEPIAPAAAGG
jgi:biopolymer transport protein TolR